MTIKKAVILAAGAGKRLEPITTTRPKHLIPIAGKPILQYTIESLKDIGITEILLIIGYKKQQIIDYVQNKENFGIKIQFVEQKKYLGTAHAANLAKPFVSNEKFMLVYGDLLMEHRIFQELLDWMDKEQNIIVCKKVSDPTKFGVIACDSEGYVQKIIEKPSDESYGNLINAGVYMFSPQIFEAIAQTKKSPRNEFELTDAIEILLSKNHTMRAIDIKEFYWSDIGRPWDILSANKHFIEKIESNKQGKIEEGVHIKGKIHIGKGTLIKSGTYIEGPVFIGKSCVIGPSSYIRPYSSIGNEVRIGNSSEIKNTVVLDHTHISHLSYVGDSVIGENVNFGAGTIVSNVRLDKKEISMIVKGKNVKTGRKKLGTVIGDNVQLGIGSMIMVGKKIGANAFIGPGTIVDRDVVENGKLYVKLNCTVEKPKKPE